MQQHTPNNENCMYDQIDGTPLSRHNHQLSSTSNRDFSSRKLGMSPYLSQHSPTSKLSSALAHSQAILGTNLPLRRQLSNKSSLSLAGGAIFLCSIFYALYLSLSLNPCLSVVSIQISRWRVKKIEIFNIHKYKINLNFKLF